MPTPIIPIITETSTNTLVNITNGTKIYQQQEITITHISYTINKTNITNTDWITNTINSIPQLDKIETILDKVWYQDPTVWGAIATVISAIAMIVTAYIMYQGNKISAKSSADSIHEMKEQYKQQKKDIQDREEKQEEANQYREDKKELRDFIEKYLISEIEKRRESIKKTDYKLSEQNIESFNSYSYDSLLRLIHYSIGLFYEDKLIEIFNKIRTYSHIINFSKEYSEVVKKLVGGLLQVISNVLYKALIDDQAFIGLIDDIGLLTNRLEKNLTPKEKEKIKLYNSQKNN